MKIVVFGASGRTGRPLVEQALAAGRHVTAFVRDPARLETRHERLTVVQGDVHDAARPRGRGGAGGRAFDPGPGP